MILNYLISEKCDISWCAIKDVLKNRNEYFTVKIDKSTPTVNRVAIAYYFNFYVENIKFIAKFILIYADVWEFFMNLEFISYFTERMRQ